MPRSRPPRRSPAISLVATRTTRSPWTTKNRSKAPETCRQSSSAHTRSSSKPRAQSSAATNPRSPTAMVSSPTSSPEVAPTAAIVCELLCMSAPSTIMSFVPSSRPEADARRTWLAGGAATLLSSHAGPSPTGDERHSESQSGPTADSVKASQLAAGRSLTSRPDVTGPIQTASVRSAPTPRPFPTTALDVQSDSSGAGTPMLTPQQGSGADGASGVACASPS